MVTKIQMAGIFEKSWENFVLSSALDIGAKMDKIDAMPT